MSKPTMTETELQRDFMYLFERLGEPLGLGVKGSGSNMVYYNVPRTESVSFTILLTYCSQFSSFCLIHQNLQSTVTTEMMGQVQQTINVEMPTKMPTEELKEISKLCPKNGLFGHFIPSHRKALIGLRKIFLGTNLTNNYALKYCF